MRNDERPVLCADVEVHFVEDGCVVYVPDGRHVHFLNETAMLVLDQCDGQIAWGDMQAELERRTGVPVEFDIRDTILPQFEAAHIIEPAQS